MPINPEAAIDEILNATYCGDMFDQDADHIREKYKQYVKLVHPDVCKLPNAQAAFEKLYKLYNSALDNLQKGTWEQNEVLWIAGSGIKYLNKKEFELGTRYVTRNEIIYIFNPGKEKYMQRYLRSIDAFRYANKDIQRKHDRLTPKVSHSSADAIYLMKKATEYPMDSAMAAYRYGFSGRDISWMISRMCNLVCYLHHVGLVHNGIKPENLFIDFENHSISLYGGFWYAVEEGCYMIGTSKDIYDLMPSNVKTSKLADIITDLESIKAIARKLIKDAKDVPKQIKDWANSGSSSDPVAEFHKWDRALEAAYGERKFVVFSANADEIYNNN